MQSAVETLSPTRVRLTVDVPFVELKPELDSAYRKIGAQVRVQGFRPGKVPLSVVRQRYGTAVMSEVLEQSVNDATRQVLEDRGLRSATQPKVAVVSVDDGRDLEFNVELDRDRAAASGPPADAPSSPEPRAPRTHD